jgi:hypothetical protein
MNRAAQRKLATMLAAFGLLVFAGVVYLAFFFPKAIAVSDGQSLSVPEEMVWRLSVFCKNYGLILLPLLLAELGACVLWIVLSAQNMAKNGNLSHQASERSKSQDIGTKP